MAKREEYTQADMFPVDPRIENLGMTQFKISGASVTIVVEGVVNVNDIALLTVECQQRGIAEWLLKLCGGDVDVAMVQVKKAYVEYINKQGESHRPTPVADDLTDVVKEAMSQVIEEHTGKRNGKNKKGKDDSSVIPMTTDDRVIALPHLN